jgi:hypothetical protein
MRSLSLLVAGATLLDGALAHCKKVKEVDVDYTDSLKIDGQHLLLMEQNLRIITTFGNSIVQTDTPSVDILHQTEYELQLAHYECKHN